MKMLVLKLINERIGALNLDLVQNPINRTHGTHEARIQELERLRTQVERLS